MGFAVATCLFWASVLGITFPFLLDSLGTVGAFGLYAGFNLVAFIAIFLFVPETKQKTLEELDYVFAVKTRDFMKYQCTKALPWFIKRWVFWQRNAKLEPLYEFDRVKEAERERKAEETGAVTKATGIETDEKNAKGLSHVHAPNA